MLDLYRASGELFLHFVTTFYGQPVDNRLILVPFELDPSFKEYEQFPIVSGLEIAMGYDRSSFLASAGGSVTSNSVEGLSFLNISTDLASYTANLMSYINEHANGASVAEIVSGRKIIPEEFDDLPTVLPFTVSGSTGVWQEIPGIYGMVLQIEIGDIDEPIFTSDLGGKRFSLTFSGNRAVLSLDDTVLFEEGGAPGPGTVDMIWTIWNPAAWIGLQPPTTYSYDRAGKYALIYGFSPSRHYLKSRERKLEAYRRADPTGTSPKVITETLNVMGISWLWQTHRTDQLIGQLLDVKSLPHHRFGRMGQEDGFFIDVGTQFYSYVSNTGDTAAADLNFRLAGYFESALEHSIIEQLQGSFYESASTIKLLYEANRLDQEIFMTDDTNWDIVKEELSDDYYFDPLQEEIDYGSTLILPEEGAISINEWSGSGYVVSGPNFQAMMIGGDYKGGYAGEEGTVEPETTLDEVSSSPEHVVPGPSTHTNPASTEPVDLASGAYFLNALDLSLGGSGVRGLTFERNYNSNRRYFDTTGLGPGWTHNYDSRVVERSAPEAALGLTSPHEAAALIVSAFVAADLFENPTTAKEWVTTALVTHWGVESIFKNAVVLSIGQKSFQFIRNPDGTVPADTFQSPAGVAAELSIVNGNYVLTEPFGNTYRFNAENRIEEIEDFFGNTKRFDYQDGRLQTVTDSSLRVLTLNYTGERLTSVSDSTDQTVSYGHDGEGNLTTYTDPESKIWRYDYDSAHRMWQLKDAESRIIAENVYDVFDRVKEQRAYGDANQTWTFHYSGASTIEQNPLGGQTRYFFDEQGRTISRTNEVGDRSDTKFDGQNRPVVALSPAGREVLSYYDPEHNLRARSDAREGEVLGLVLDSVSTFFDIVILFKLRS